MLLIKDLNPDTQVPIPLAAEMLEVDPQKFLLQLVDSSLEIFFIFKIFNDNRMFRLTGSLDHQKRDMIMNIIQFGIATYHGTNCIFREPLSSDGRKCSERKCYRPDWCGEPYDAHIEMKHVSVKAGDIALLTTSIKQSAPDEIDHLRQDDAEGVPLADNNHPCFSIELHAAVLCWQALYGAGTKECLKNRKANIREWLKNNCKDLTREAIERVATIVNPSCLKKGGATPIS